MSRQKFWKLPKTDENHLKLPISNLSLHMKFLFYLQILQYYLDLYTWQYTNLLQILMKTSNLWSTCHGESSRGLLSHRLRAKNHRHVVVIWSWIIVHLAVGCAQSKWIMWGEGMLLNRTLLSLIIPFEKVRQITTKLLWNSENWNTRNTYRMACVDARESKQQTAVVISYFRVGLVLLFQNWVQGSPCSFERKGAFISLSSLVWEKYLTCTCSCVHANDVKIVRSRDA